MSLRLIAADGNHYGYGEELDTALIDQPELYFKTAAEFKQALDSL